MFIPDAQTQYIVASHLNRFQLKVVIMNGDKLSQWLEDEGAEYSPLDSIAEGTTCFTLANGRIAIVRLYNSRGTDLSNFHKCAAVEQPELTPSDMLRAMGF